MAEVNRCDNCHEYAGSCLCYGNPDDVQPFSNGSQFGDWTSSNCASCSKAASPDANYDDMPCEIEKALTLAYLTSGRIPLEIADRMGRGNGRYGWPCMEHDPPFANVRPDGTVDPSIAKAVPA